MIEAVIFDMDGVIIDSEPMHKDVNFELFKEYGINMTFDEYNTFIGMSNKDYWATVKNKYNLKQSISELGNADAKRNLTHLKSSNAKPISGIVPLLKTLKEKGIKIGLASSSPLELIFAVIEKLEIKSFFDSVNSGQDLQNGKPAPDIFLKSAGELGVNPEKSPLLKTLKMV